jgi:hypothetical protein
MGLGARARASGFAAALGGRTLLLPFGCRCVHGDGYGYGDGDCYGDSDSNCNCFGDSDCFGYGYGYGFGMAFVSPRSSAVEKQPSVLRGSASLRGSARNEAAEIHPEGR